MYTKLHKILVIYFAGEAKDLVSIFHHMTC